MAMLLVYHDKLNCCNKVLKHMQHGSATFLVEIIVLLVSTYVTLGILCNQGVEWLIMSYNTLITFRVISGTMFMLTKMTKMPS
jgi:undecaprenyl pyrophosphate phosphatase UppP